ncbi:hypothetical protein A3G65_01820 [Candidatus Roizmanbacteria bacterium RIFCSPLOWO2_12_FULL_37_7b]|nr:MAG: hypothetical protein A3G65_01820 [Candidatus Roizmanbacteria bacterium RIFCSPLOWO2_12_FULL_37_7b]
MKNVIHSIDNQACPKCNATLGPVETTPIGRQIQRCSNGSWDRTTRQVNGCTYARWSYPQPEKLDEECPKCSEPLVLVSTRKGSKLKRCSTAGWDRATKTVTGCDYVEWVK